MGYRWCLSWPRSTFIQYKAELSTKLKQYEFLKQLSANPANTVIGTARTPSKVEQQLKADGIANAHIYTADLDKHESLKSVAQEVEKKYSAVDYLIINGAYASTTTGQLSPTGFNGQEELLEKDMNQSILTNAIGPLNSINAFLPLVRNGKQKKIIVISTGMADPGIIEVASVAGAVTYSASKAAVNIIVSKFAVELKPEDISIIAISPGLVNTEKACSPNN